MGGMSGGGAGASTADAVSITDAGGLYTGSNVEAALQEVGGVYVRACWYYSVASGTSGTLTPPTGGTIVLNQWPDAADALASTVGSDGAPDWATPHTAGGAAITATLDGSGNWTLTGTPSAYPVAVVFCYEVPMTKFDRTKSLFEITNAEAGGTSLITSVASIAAAKALAGTADKLIYVLDKQSIYQYCATCSITADDDLILTTGDGGDTRWQLIQKMSRTQGDTGWIERDGATLTALSSTTVRLALSSSATLALKGVRFQLAAGNYDCVLSGSAGVRYIGWNDSTGTLYSQSYIWDFSTQVPVAIAYWSGTAIVAAPQTEFHGIRDTIWHYSHHFEFGLQLSSGLVFTGAVQTDNAVNPADDTCTYLWSTTGATVDEDYYSYPGTLQWAQTLGSGLTSGTAGIFPFLYYNGSAIVGAAAMADRAPFIHAGGNTTPQWENAGTLTASVTGNYVVYHYFTSPMVGGWSVFARPHNAVFASLSLALGARPNALTWSNYAEVKHLYSAVWRVNTSNYTNATHRAKLVALTDYRLVAGSPTAGVSATDHQALSNRNATGAHPATSIENTPAGNIAATTVQAAIDELDSEKAATGHAHTGADGTSKLAQANTHESADTDSATTALHHTLGTGANQAAAGNDSRLSDARTPTAHATSHQNGGSDEVATATAAANAIPKAGAGGTLATGWIPDLSATYATAAKGVTNGDSHDHNGGDGAAIVEAAITLADNTTNNVSATKHGLFPKLPSVSDAKYYGIKDGAVAEIPAASGMAAGTESGTKSTATHGATASNTGSIAIGDEATTGGAVASAAGAIAIGTKGTVATTASGADSVAIGTGAEATSTSAIAIGKNADAKTGAQVIAIGTDSAATAASAIAIGWSANANNTYSILIGQGTGGGTRSVSIGLSAGSTNGTDTYAVSIGDSAGGGYASIALGAHSVAQRYGSFSVSGDHVTGNKNPWTQVQWKGQTTDATATELYLHGVSANRCTVVASSAIHFLIQLVAREPATGDCKIVEVKGGIKRDGSNNTAMIGSVTSTTICEDAGASAWSVSVTADDTNEALKVAVTGEASHTINWHAVGHLIEVKD